MAQEPVTCIVAAADGVRIRILVVPGASRDEVVGVHGDALRVKVSAPPEKGRANAAVVELLARALGVRHGDVAIASGHGGRRKVAVVRALTADTVRLRLGL